MKPRVAVVDYGMGNLRSVQKALENAGAEARVTASPTELKRADAVVLPGVGAFGQAARRLQSEGLIGPLSDALEQEKPFLGICLGLQLLFERSEESPKVKGIGFFKGDVVRFQERKKDASFKIPHMGWNTLQKGPASTRCLSGLGTRDYFYFVHSYFPDPSEKDIVAARTTYGKAFCSAVAKRNLFASQFHPEKSGAQGLRLLRNFMRGVTAC